MQQSSRGVEAAILDGFGRMRGADRVLAGEIRDGARELEHAVIGAGRQVEPRDGLLEKRLGGILGGAIFFQLARAELAVRLALAGGLPRSRTGSEPSPWLAEVNSSSRSAGTSIWMSMRSSKGPEILPR